MSELDNIVTIADSMAMRLAYKTSKKAKSLGNTKESAAKKQKLSE